MMKLLACNCLNIHVQIDENATLHVSNREISEIERRHPFFQRFLVNSNLYVISKRQSCLVRQFKMKSWLLYQCLNCNVFAYAIGHNGNVLLVNKSLRVMKMDDLLEKDRHFSPVFKIIICSGIENHEDMGNVRTLGLYLSPPSDSYKSVLKMLEKNLSRSVECETQLVEERIRLYEEKQRLALQKYKARAESDLNALKTKLQAKIFGARDSEVDSGKSLDENARNAHRKKYEKLVASFRKSQAIKKFGPPSLDSEGLFALDGVDDAEISDNDDDEKSGGKNDDDDIELTEDFELHTVQENKTGYARSAPIDVPEYLNSVSSRRDDSDDCEFVQLGAEFIEHHQDIAASIKAMASSARGEDVIFGDLPPRRFRAD